jgi:hypothetical protein
MDNWLKEFEELLLDNALLKVHNQTLVDKTLNGRNGDRPYRKLQKNTSKTVWK